VCVSFRHLRCSFHCIFHASANVVAGCVMYSGCLWVCPCVSNVVNTVSWKMLDIFSPNSPLHAFWDKDECFKTWGHGASNMLENVLFGLINVILWKLLYLISLSLMHWDEGEALMFVVTRSKVKVTAWLRSQQAETYGAVCRVVISSRYFIINYTIAHLLLGSILSHCFVLLMWHILVAHFCWDKWCH